MTCIYLSFIVAVPGSTQEPLVQKIYYPQDWAGMSKADISGESINREYDSHGSYGVVMVFNFKRLVKSPLYYVIRQRNCCIPCIPADKESSVYIYVYPCLPNVYPCISVYTRIYPCIPVYSYYFLPAI